VDKKIKIYLNEKLPFHIQNAVKEHVKTSPIDIPTKLVDKTIKKEILDYLQKHGLLRFLRDVASSECKSYFDKYLRKKRRKVR